MPLLSKKKALLVIGVPFLIFLAVVVTVGVLRYQAESKNTALWAAPFEPHLEEYLQGSTAEPLDREKLNPEEGHIRGKLVVANRATGELDTLNSLEGLADLRAGSPEEVGTVVWIRYWRVWEKSVHGGFINKNYYTYGVDVTIIDFADKNIVCTYKVTDYAEETYRGEITTPRLTDAVVTYLQSLPRE